MFFSCATKINYGMLVVDQTIVVERYDNSIIV